jgi:hypothetical protein
MVFLHCRLRPFSRCLCATDFEFLRHPTNVLRTLLLFIYLFIYFYSMFSLLIQTQKPISSYRFSDRLRVACCLTDFVFLIRSYISLHFYFILFLSRSFFALCFPFIVTRIGLEVAFSTSDWQLIVLQPI